MKNWPEAVKWRKFFANNCLFGLRRITSSAPLNSDCSTIMKTNHLLPLLVFVCLLSCQSKKDEPIPEEILYTSTKYEDLVSLFKDWRNFETPPLLDGAPDYTAGTFKDRWLRFLELQKNLKSIDTAGWPVENKIDWMIVWAEMNGYDFNHQVLKPWVRDPAYYKTVWTYKSDVPAHEGPTHHATLELWTYSFPLSAEERERLMEDLKVILPLNQQARKNLTGNAKELWIAGIRDIETQASVLEGLKNERSLAQDAELLNLLNQTIASTNDFVDWLKAESENKTGPSGIGKENYSWYMQHVHLVPLSWEDEFMILKRELARAWSSLKLEEHKNRNLPELLDANSPEAYDRLADRGSQQPDELPRTRRNRHRQTILGPGPT